MKTQIAGLIPSTVSSPSKKSQKKAKGHSPKGGLSSDFLIVLDAAGSAEY